MNGFFSVFESLHFGFLLQGEISSAEIFLLIRMQLAFVTVRSSVRLVGLCRQHTAVTAPVNWNRVMLHVATDTGAVESAASRSESWTQCKIALNLRSC